MIIDLVIILFILGVGFMAILATYVSEERWGSAWGAAIFAFVMFGAATFLAAPHMGYGHVPTGASEFLKQLDEGVAYQTIASSKEGDEYVLLVKKFGVSDFRAIRVKTMPPKIFTLVNGQPAAIAPPGTK